MVIDSACFQFCTVQVPFELEGEYGVLEFMHQRLKKNGIAVIVIAEGAGQVGFVTSSVSNVFLKHTPSWDLTIDITSC